LERVEEGAAFSERETALLLEGAAMDRLPQATRQKLERWDLVDLYDVLPRNLRALLQGALRRSAVSIEASTERSADEEGR
jgi:hypothetical protein